MKRFVIDMPQDRLDDLRERLERTRWPDALEGVGWSYGTPPGAVRELVAYWCDGYSWREHEARLNELPQYTTEIDGQRVHFAHVRSARPDALPLLLTHGWPSSFADFSHVAGPLSRDFHLVIPSIPGFACSGPTTEPGWGVRRVAAAWAEVLDRDVVLLGQPPGDQRAVAGLGVAFDTEQRRGPTARQLRHDRREVGAVEDLGGVAAGVLGGEFAARALADPLAVILGVLEPA
nr:epoxide hydrolase N-terminal domain-containing protein [Nonomuraea cypriaca]